jgi:hypothetical protein
MRIKSSQQLPFQIQHHITMKPNFTALPKIIQSAIADSPTEGRIAAVKDGTARPLAFIEAGGSRLLSWGYWMATISLSLKEGEWWNNKNRGL